MSDHPAHEIRVGNVRATIWRNSKPHSVWYSVSIERRYRQEETWKTSNSFGADELPLVCKAAEMAYGWIWKAGSETQ